MTAEIAAAYVSKNSIPASDLPQLIETIFNSLGSLCLPTVDGAVEEAKQKPAVSLKKSVTDDYIICLEDGKQFKSLRRHLMTHYNMTPEDYRAKWGLPGDYPMVAPNYAAKRSELARSMGLGRKAGGRKARAKG